MAEPILINLHPNKNGQGLNYYQFAIDQDRYMASCNTLDNLSNRICVPILT